MVSFVSHSLEIPVLFSLCLSCFPMGLVCPDPDKPSPSWTSMTPADQQENQGRQCLTISIVQMRSRHGPKVHGWEAMGLGVLGRWEAVEKRQHPG